MSQHFSLHLISSECSADPLLPLVLSLKGIGQDFCREVYVSRFQGVNTLLIGANAPRRSWRLKLRADVGGANTKSDLYHSETLY